MTRLASFLALSSVLAMTGCYGSAAVLDRSDTGVDDAHPRVDSGDQQPLPVCDPSLTIPQLGAAVMTVEASGAVSYRLSPWPPPTDPIDVTATLDAVDTVASTLHLTSTTGAIDVVVQPVDAALLEALPLGRRVVARFDRGVTLTDASDGTLLFAALSVNRTAELDAGVFHFEQRDSACVTAWFPGTTFTCAVGLVALDVEVAADGYEATLSLVQPQDTTTIGGRTFSITLVGSRRRASLAEVRSQLPTANGECALGLTEDLAVMVGSL